MNNTADDQPHSQCCCPGDTPREDGHSADDAGAEWIVGSVDTPLGNVPTASTTLGCKDRVTAWKARWGINRMHHRVNPQLYAVGHPTAESPVFVSANYKISFDQLRGAMKGIDGWILVLDTKGIGHKS